MLPWVENEEEIESERGSPLRKCWWIVKKSLSVDVVCRDRFRVIPDNYCARECFAADPCV